MRAYQLLSPIGHFSLAASFGNVHGVYKPGNVKLRPEILKNSPLWLIDNETWLSTKVSSTKHFRALSNWLRQLEVCLDNKWLSRVSLYEIVG